MTILERLKVELANKQYYDDQVFEMYLLENNLIALEDYDKDTMQYNLLTTVIDVLESLANNIELFRRTQTEFASIGEAHTHLEKRINAIKKRLLTLEYTDNTPSPFTMLFRGGR